MRQWIKPEAEGCLWLSVEENWEVLIPELTFFEDCAILSRGIGLTGSSSLTRK